MKTFTAILLLARLAAGEAAQEHSHEGILLATQEMLALDNPLNIDNVAFGLLGDEAAAGGAGNVTNLKCLQQNGADQAFTNAKAAGDVTGMAMALMFRALERNVGQTGGVSETCDEVAVNPEIAAIQQHQDPASTPALSGFNRKVTLDLATQLAAIGADPNLAIQTGTFPPGLLAENGDDGFICDDIEDTVGCIFTLGLLVADVSEAEIAAHLAGLQVDVSAASVFPAAVAPAGEPVLLALAEEVLAGKDTIDLQRTANAKGTLFTIGAGLAAAHPNAVDAQRAAAAALADSLVGDVAAALNADNVNVRCLTAVRQTVKQSNDQDNTAKLDVVTGVNTCVRAQAALGLA